MPAPLIFSPDRFKHPSTEHTLPLFDQIESHASRSCSPPHPVILHTPTSQTLDRRHTEPKQSPGEARNVGASSPRGQSSLTLPQDPPEKVSPPADQGQRRPRLCSSSYSGAVAEARRTDASICEVVDTPSLSRPGEGSTDYFGPAACKPPSVGGAVSSAHQSESSLLVNSVDQVETQQSQKLAAQEVEGEVATRMSDNERCGQGQGEEAKAEDLTSDLPIVRGNTTPTLDDLYDMYYSSSRRPSEASAATSTARVIKWESQSKGSQPPLDPLRAIKESDPASSEGRRIIKRGSLTFVDNSKKERREHRRLHSIPPACTTADKSTDD